ncbi:MAG: hypothetical protein H7A35_07060 [Planctomycetales bacterium]|nr:hypothetical protein [bacterium]UNM09812.1 MAG: hypothetical protein H7A35_07060 [Planctomycetales bacterium]
MRSMIYAVAAVLLVLAMAVVHMLSSADAAGGSREGQRIGMAVAGDHTDDAYCQVSDWLSELD